MFVLTLTLLAGCNFDLSKLGDLVDVIEEIDPSGLAAINKPPSIVVYAPGDVHPAGGPAAVSLLVADDQTAGDQLFASLVVDGELTEILAPTADGLIETEVTLGLGAHLLGFTAMDDNGGITLLQHPISVVDVGVPVVEITAPRPMDVTGTNLEVLGQVVDREDTAADLVANLVVDGGAPEPIDLDEAGMFRVAIDGLPSGTHTLEVWATDRDGNEGLASGSFVVIAP